MYSRLLPIEGFPTATYVVGPLSPHGISPWSWSPSLYHSCLGFLGVWANYVLPYRPPISLPGWTIRSQTSSRWWPSYMLPTPILFNSPLPTFHKVKLPAAFLAGGSWVDIRNLDTARSYSASRTCQHYSLYHEKNPSDFPHKKPRRKLLLHVSQQPSIGPSPTSLRCAEMGPLLVLFFSQIH